MRQGRWRATLEYLDRGIAEDHGDSRRAIHVGFKRGVKALSLLEVGNHQEALHECRTALTHCEAAKWWFFHGPNLYILLARLLAQDSLHDEAKKLVDTTFGGVPEHDVARRMRYFLGHGLVHFHEGDSDQALTELERAEQIRPRWLSPEHFLLESTLGKPYLKYQRPDRTVELLEDSMRTFAESRAWHMIGDVKNHYYLGRAYEQSGWIERACEQYKTFLTIWSNAEPGFSEIEDAERRLAHLRTQ